ncbi:hypothetical protein SH139x_005414 [Planctomycetaceae bacterium SH139]
MRTSYFGIMTTLLTLTMVGGSGTGAIAHPGHGAAEHQGVASHYVTEPLHLLMWAGLAIGCLIGVRLFQTGRLPRLR